ncbi:DCC family protein chloroplastic [Dorcoceras hygrometricum]|uniref:DCC family protein chloroplastic n=1 Tax=Dorcoceras hygrometricum TaxID=472368 RepID=A0A2Z7CV43_9LAMI|nr:DCC family protein chloroplastic [Dorcoceras hygrometricum]
MTVLRRGVRSALTAFLVGRETWSATTSAPLICRRHSTGPVESLLSSPADPMLLDGSDAAVVDAVGVVPTLLQPRVVVYDGVCHVCHSGVKWIIKADKDKKIKFCCLQSKAAEPYMRVSGVDRDDVLRSILFVEGPDLYHQGSTAGLRVLSYLPLPYSALSSLMIIPTPLRDFVYDYVAKRRYDWFGKDDDCLVLKQTELLERFIDWEELLERSRQRQS